MSLLDAGMHSDNPSVIIDSDAMFGEDMFGYSTLRRRSSSRGRTGEIQYLQENITLLHSIFITLKYSIHSEVSNCNSPLQVSGTVMQRHQRETQYSACVTATGWCVMMCLSADSTRIVQMASYLTYPRNPPFLDKILSILEKSCNFGQKRKEQVLVSHTSLPCIQSWLQSMCRVSYVSGDGLIMSPSRSMM